MYCFGSQKTQFTSGFMERTIIDITQLESPQLADIGLPGISCTFACQNKSWHVCSTKSALLSLHIIDIFQMTGLLRHTLFLTSKRQSISPPTWKITSNYRWRLELLQVMWCWMTYSVSFWWHSRIIYRRLKCTNLVTRSIPCQSTLDGIYALGVRKLKCI